MGILSIDLKKLARDYDGKPMNCFIDEDGSRASDAEARETISRYIAEGYDLIPLRMERLPEPDFAKEPPRLTRLRAKLAELESEHMRLIREQGMLVPPAMLMAKIGACKTEIANEEARLPKQLSKLISKEKLRESGLAKKMVKTHIAADYLTETAMVMREALDEFGFKECSLTPYLDAIESQAAAYAAVVCHPEFAGLSHFLSTNEALINDLDLIVDRHLNEHMEIKG